MPSRDEVASKSREKLTFVIGPLEPGFGMTFEKDFYRLHLQRFTHNGLRMWWTLKANTILTR